MPNTISVNGAIDKAPRHLVTAEGLHILSFRVQEENGNSFVVHTRGQLAADNAEKLSKGQRVTVGGALILRPYDAGTFSGISAEISAEWIGEGANGDQFAEGAKYVLEDLSDLFSGVEHTDIWREFFPDDEEEDN